jgi:hypothetical protein
MMAPSEIEVIEAARVASVGRASALSYHASARRTVSTHGQDIDLAAKVLGHCNRSDEALRWGRPNARPTQSGIETQGAMAGARTAPQKERSFQQIMRATGTAAPPAMMPWA